ncbi:MAG: GH1 family beta-glucosidase [Spirochaetes bacterium]|nr:GH1 family beta-glucosidase [Spirochaetota bacterium]
MKSPLRNDGFPSDFIWGCGTASYQIEGAAKEDGRGPSIWDEQASFSGRILDGSDGSQACDSYHRYMEDIELLKTLGVGAYRFSIAWPRIQPEGRGKPLNPGLDYYSRLVDALLEKGIEPWATLYHWDLPLALERAGGWTNRETSYRFVEYTAIMFEKLGGRVKSWTSVNEPWCSAFLGYQYGEHAPGLHDPKAAIAAVHHLLLAHGLCAQAHRDSGKGGVFGIVINPSTPRPATGCPGDLAAARRASLERTALWLDPVFGRGYPKEYTDAAPAEFPVKTGDMDLIASPVDFIGVNYYDENVVAECKPTPDAPWGYAKVPSWQEKTEMDWYIVPQGLRRVLRHISREYSPKAIYVTENGAAFKDEVSKDGGIHDPGRIDYLKSHLGACREAIVDGVPLRGYFVWSLLDNFEWAWGYTRKFGITAVEPGSFARKPKDSFYYYRDAVAGFGLD